MRLKSYLIRLIGLLVVFSYLALPSPVQAGCGTTTIYYTCTGSCSCPAGYTGSCVCDAGDDPGINCTPNTSGCIAPSPTPYPCIQNGGYCSPEPCGDDSCGSGSCGGWYCCKACPAPTSTPAPTTAPTKPPCPYSCVTAGTCPADYRYNGYECTNGGDCCNGPTITPFMTATPTPEFCYCSGAHCVGNVTHCTFGNYIGCSNCTAPNGEVYDYCSDPGQGSCSGSYCTYVASCNPNPTAQQCNPNNPGCGATPVPLDCNYNATGCNVCGYGRSQTIYCNGVHCGDICVSNSQCDSNQWCTVPSPTGGGGATNTPGGPTNTPSPTATPTATPTPGPWVKLKNTSFYSSHSLTSLIPLSPVAYDSDDDATANFIIGDGGLVCSPYINLTGINSSAKPNASDWSVSYTPTFRFQPPVSFLAYVKSRKEYTKITDLSQITADGIYFWDATTPLDFDSIPSQFNSYNVVLISSGTVTINTDLNKTADPNLKSIAILAPTINFAPTVTQADGIFIASTIDTGATANQGLKIVGNLIAQNSLINQRQWSNPDKPVLFIVFDSKKYLDLLPYLSTTKYEWKQTQ